MVLRKDGSRLAVGRDMPHAPCHLAADPAIGLVLEPVLMNEAQVPVPLALGSLLVCKSLRQQYLRSSRGSNSR